MGSQSPIISVDVNQTGVNITTSAASASAAIPNTSAGITAKYVRIMATAFAHVKVGKGSATAVATDTLVGPNCDLIFNVSGADTIAAIQDTAAGVVNIVPLEYS